MAEAGGATMGSVTIMDPLFIGTYFFRSKPIPDKMKEVHRRSMEAWVEDQEEDERDEMPPYVIIMFPDLVEKAWGWERLLPTYGGVAWSDYSKYLQAYHKNNAPGHDAGTAAATGSTLVAVAERCLKKENQLASEWKCLLESHTDAILLRKNIILSSLVKECAHSVILKEGAKSSGASVIAAFMCLEEETDLILELLRRGAHPDDYFIEKSSQIRMCALGLMNHSDIAAGAMLGIAKEARMMCEWMRENQELLDSSCYGAELPDKIEDGDMIRCRTLQFLTSILTMPYTPAAVLKPVMEATDTRGDDASDKLNRQDQEMIVDADNSKKRERIEEAMKDTIESQSEWAEAGAAMSGSVTITGSICCLEALDLANTVHAPHLCHAEKAVLPICPAKYPEFHMEKTWGFSWLLPFSCSVNWSDYINYLHEYYKRLAPELLREVAANYPEVYPANRIGNLCAAANFCLKMEENLLSELRIRLTPAPNYMLPINTIIESSLIRNRAHSSFCPTGEEFSVASAVAFVCIALEADLMCESLRYGAKPTDDIIKQSSVIRLCALSLLNLKGNQSVLAAVAMLGIAKEVKMICDWVKKEKEPVNFSSSTPHELGESHFIHIRLLDVMTNIVLKSFFPSSEMEHVAMAKK